MGDHSPPTFGFANKWPQSGARTLSRYWPKRVLMIRLEKAFAAIRRETDLYEECNAKHVRHAYRSRDAAGFDCSWPYLSVAESES